MGQSFAETRPTSGHLALAALLRKGLVKHVISQNVDGLHLRSGIAPAKLCELHGNVFRERCPGCGKEYMRSFDVTGKSAYHRHGTERACEHAKCARTELRDTIVYFGEKIASADLVTAQEQSERCDLAIFVGSSLKVLQHYKFIWQQPPKPQRKRVVIVNLQPTPKDRAAELKINGRCDAVLEQLATLCELSPLPYSPAKDEVLKRAVAPAPGSALASRAKRQDESEEEDDAEAQDELEAPAPPAPLPPLRALSPRMRAPSPRLMARASSIDSVKASPPEGGRALSPAAAPAAPASAAAAAAPKKRKAPSAATAAAPLKCKAKCGFFASADNADGLCSKCCAKRAEEMAQWHGALSKKRFST